MIDITRPSKYALTLPSPVMLASGVAGYGGVQYADLINLKKLGAIVTNPITLNPWSPAKGTRVVPLDSGVLMHTGYPNRGLKAVIGEYRSVWANAPVTVIAHVIATSKSDLRHVAQLIDREDTLPALELGLPDDIDADTASELVKSAVQHTEKPVIVRLPMYDAYEIAESVADAGAGALVVCAPPRGTARDPHSGRLVSGRIYSPLLQPMALRMVGVLRKRVDDSVPIIGCGGIHSLQDARDFMDAGAVAVQLDSVTWIQPNIVERIARDLSGGLVTRATGAFSDEWHADMGDTEYRALFHGGDKPAQDNV